MAGIPRGTYSALEAGGSVTAISMEGGEINAFGSTYTGLELGEVKSYPKIKDDLTSLKVVDNTTSMLVTGLGVAVIFAGLAIATVVTGGAALAACALAGAAVGTGAASVGMYQSDKKTGYDRGWDEFALGLAVGAASGAMTGAVLYGTVIAAPAAGTIAGMQAEYYLGASAFTQTVVPAIMTTGTYGLAATTGVYAANDIYASNSGYNVILDKVFHNDVGKYEAAGMVLYALNGAVVEYVAANEFLLNAKKGIQFNEKAERLQKNKAKGKAYEQQEYEKFKTKFKNAESQVTIKSSSGIKIRVDAIGLDDDGNVVIYEFKSSSTAPLTKNQKAAFPQIKASGGVVVGKGKGIFNNGYKIPPGENRIKVIRPE